MSLIETHLSYTQLFEPNAFSSILPPPSDPNLLTNEHNSNRNSSKIFLLKASHKKQPITLKCLGILTYSHG